MQLFFFVRDIPLAVKVNNHLKANGINLEGDIITPQDLVCAIAKYKNQGGASLIVKSIPLSVIVNIHQDAKTLT